MSVQAKRQAIQTGFQTADPTLVDATNMTDLVSQFADLAGIRAAKLEALQQKFEINQWVDQDGNRGSFHFNHKGATFVVSEVQENSEGERYRRGNILAPDDVCCDQTFFFKVFFKVFFMFFCPRIQNAKKRSGCDILREDNTTCAPQDFAVTLVAQSYKQLAEHLLNSVDDGKFCSLCGQINTLSGAFCKECALAELKQPCAGCGLTIGRRVPPTRYYTNDDDDNEPIEHPVCKRRRIN
jgi:hypothetical protein